MKYDGIKNITKVVQKADNIELYQKLLTYIILVEDKNDIKYCSYCWDADNKLIQTNEYSGGMFGCNKCRNRSY